MADGKRTGWQVCADTARDIQNFVQSELFVFGHLSNAVVTILRKQAQDDHKDHLIMKDNFQAGRGKGAQPKLK